MIKKISAAAACAACFAALTATASAATNPIGRAANGAINAGEDLINGVANAGGHRERSYRRQNQR